MKISCLTITQLSRIKLLKRCLYSYAEQSIDNHLREILIVHHEGDYATGKINELLEETGVQARIISAPKVPLGSLRNISIQHAEGELLCQWDDDDFYHPNRLEMQSKPFEKEKCIATTLETQFFWFCKKGTIYIRKGGNEGIHGSIMFRNGIGLKYNDDMQKGEDTELMRAIISHGPKSIFRVDGHPELYVRTYHGLNTWSFEHHNKHIQQAFDADWLIENELIIRSALKVLKITGVKVCDRNDKIVFTT